MENKQYHHYIPRFILRRFQPAPDSEGTDLTMTKTRKQRDKERAKAKRRGKQVDDDGITVFDMASKSIKTAPIAKNFGSFNLYQDAIQFPGNLNHLETKFSSLEREASEVIARLHASADRGDVKFTIYRPELELMRKFLFLMHFRKGELRETYFQEDHPGNAKIRSWIRHVKQTRGYTSDSQLWLDGLRYYLETPHADILNLASKQGTYDGMAGELDINTPPDNWHSIAYAKYSRMYFMGIWKADETSEFVLGDNSYGLWEGTFLGETGLFHIYPMSPRITLVLKMTVGKDPSLAALVTSTLGNHPFEPPETKYNFPIGRRLPSFSTAQERQEGFARHLLTPHSRKDQFTYKISKLTETQTYLVNQVVLANLDSANGLLVFSSHTAMLKTAQLFDTPPGPLTLSRKNREAIRNLIACLSPSTIRSVGTGAALADQLLLDRAHRFSLQDSVFDDILVQVLMNDIKFQSVYDRAHYIYRHFPPPFESKHPFVQQAVRSAIEPIHRATQYNSSPFFNRPIGLFPPGAKTRTVSSLSEGDCYWLFASVMSHLGNMGSPHLKVQRETGDGLQVVAAEVSSLMYLESLLELDANMASSLCPIITFVELIDVSSPGSGGDADLRASGPPKATEEVDADPTSAPSLSADLHGALPSPLPGQLNIDENRTHFSIHGLVPLSTYVALISFCLACIVYSLN